MANVIRQSIKLYRKSYLSKKTGSTESVFQGSIEIGGKTYQVSVQPQINTTDKGNEFQWCSVSRFESEQKPKL